MNIRRDRPTRHATLLLALVLMVAGLSGAGAASTAASTAATAAAPALAPAAVVGAPPMRYTMPTTSFFSVPNRGKAAAMVIRSRVLAMVKSTWGGPRDPRTKATLPGNGDIRMATWSFKDWTMAKALVAAHRRGVSVQVVAAKTANEDSAPWKYLRKNLGVKINASGLPATREYWSSARECSGSCRGAGGTAHAKYFLFNNVGVNHVRDMVVQTSMNLTRFAYENQWNQAQVQHSKYLYADFLAIFKQARVDTRQASPYHVRTVGAYTNYFFPRPGTTATSDPVMGVLSNVACTGATAGGTPKKRTQIRVIQYAMYGDRGLWLAKRLRYLWNRGCSVRIIYSVTSRPVLAVLRSKSGKGPVPMRRSVVENSAGEAVKYNHSKWMTITGHYGASTGAFMTFTGSANWANLSFGSDEQMQLVSSQTEALRYVGTFDRTWAQKSSHAPTAGGSYSNARVAMRGVPEDAPTWGRGEYKYMTQD